MEAALWSVRPGSTVLRSLPHLQPMEPTRRSMDATLRSYDGPVKVGINIFDSLRQASHSLRGVCGQIEFDPGKDSLRGISVMTARGRNDDSKTN